jgi:hypothetical protein
MMLVVGCGDTANGDGVFNFLSTLCVLTDSYHTDLLHVGCGDTANGDI